MIGPRDNGFPGTAVALDGPGRPYGIVFFMCDWHCQVVLAETVEVHLPPYGWTDCLCIPEPNQKHATVDRIKSIDAATRITLLQSLMYVAILDRMPLLRIHGIWRFLQLPPVTGES